MTRTSLASFTAGRLTKAATGRSRDATFSGVGGALRSLAGRGFSLIAGRETRGFAVGLDGTPVRMVDTSTSAIMQHMQLNPIVYACMRERMKFLIQPRFLVERRQSDGTYVADELHDLTSLIRHPGPNLDTPTLWRCFEASYASVGKLYLEPMYARGRLEGLNPLNPMYVHEQIVQGELQYYEWQPPDAPWVRFAPDDLIVRRAVQWADVPPLYAALGAVEADELATSFLQSFFGNSAVPPGIVKVVGRWTETQRDALITSWMQRFGPGTRTPGAPGIFDDEIESYEQVGSRLDQLDNQQLRTLLETRICMCMGISPLIIYSYAGLLRAIESNLKEAWESTWDATAIPLLREWAEWINWALLIKFESADDILLGNVRCRFDPTGIGPYQEDVAAKVAQYLEGFKARGVTLNEYRQALSLAPLPGGDVIEQPAILEIPARQEASNE